MTRILFCAATAVAGLLAAPALLPTKPNNPAAPLEGDTYTVDKVHSSVIFKVTHMNVANFYGRFNDVSGTIAIDAKNPAASSVEIAIDADSIDTHNDGRDKHLKTADFFSVKEFPKISFKSKSVKKVDDHNYEIAGDLTMRGVTKPLTAKATQTGTGKDPRSGAQSIGFETTFTVKRSEFGIKYGPGALGEDVQVTVSLEANQRRRAESNHSRAKSAAVDLTQQILLGVAIPAAVATLLWVAIWRPWARGAGGAPTPRPGGSVAVAGASSRDMWH